MFACLHACSACVSCSVVQCLRFVRLVTSSDKSCAHSRTFPQFKAQSKNLPRHAHRAPRSMHTNHFDNNIHHMYMHHVGDGGGADVQRGTPFNPSGYFFHQVFFNSCNCGTERRAGDRETLFSFEEFCLGDVFCRFFGGCCGE